MIMFTTWMNLIVVFVVLFLRQESCNGFIDVTENCQTEYEPLPKMMVTQYCGSLGFRCVNNDTYQLCFRPDGDGETEPPEQEHPCPPFTKCDEENPVFCTPIDLDMISSINYQEVSECIDRHGRDCETDADVTDGHGDFGEPPENTGDECSTTPITPTGDRCNPMVAERRELRRRKHSDIEDCYTTTEQMNSFTPAPAITIDICEDLTTSYDCIVPGFFPDAYNCTAYFVCDPRPEGKGFNVYHVLCEPGRIFVPKFRHCVLIGTILTMSLLDDSDENVCDMKNALKNDKSYEDQLEKKLLQPEQELFPSDDRNKNHHSQGLIHGHVIQPDNGNIAEKNQSPEFHENNDRSKHGQNRNHGHVYNYGKRKRDDKKLKDSGLNSPDYVSRHLKRNCDPAKENDQEVQFDANKVVLSKLNHDLSHPDSPQYVDNSEPVALKFGAYDEIQFQCSESGEIPDPMDETVFYLCRKKRGAKGYHTTRMICPPDTSFDPFRGLCSRTQRRKNDRRRKQLKVRKRNAKFNSVDSLMRNKIYHPPFSCTSEGRFPDVIDRHAYYLCFKNLGTYNAIHMNCPENFHFSEMDNSCERNKDANSISSNNLAYV